MDLMKDIYKKELRTRIAAWEGKKTDDFQYEPERAELKAQMKDWLAEKLGVDDEKKLLIANRKYFATCRQLHPRYLYRHCRGHFLYRQGHHDLL